MIAPEKIIDGLPLISRRYFTTSQAGCQAILERWMLGQRANHDQLKILSFPGLIASGAQRRKQFHQLAEKLSNSLKAPHKEMEGVPTEKSIVKTPAFKLLDQIKHAGPSFMEDDPLTEAHLIRSKDQVADVFFRLERQYNVGNTAGYETLRDEQARVSKLYLYLCTFIDALFDHDAPSPRFRILLVPQEYRDVAILSAKIVVALGQLLQPNHPISTSINAIHPGVITLPDIGVGFGFTNIHLIGAKDSHLPAWNPYDQLPYFLKKVKPDFDIKQTKAVPQILELLKDVKFTHLLDIGCGTGGILKALSDDRNCPGIGIDPSSTRINAAKRDCQSSRLDFNECGFPNTAAFAPKTLDAEFGPISRLFDKQNEMFSKETELTEKCVLFLGNTLPHIGARALRAWLHYLARKDRLPKYVIFDFLIDWIESLYGINGEVQVRLTKNNANVLKSCDGFMTTVLRPPNITRGVILTAKVVQHATQQPIVDYCMVRQHADTPETYKDLMRSWGYKIHSTSGYESGWGRHELYIAQLGPISDNLKFPGPPDGPYARVNDAWFELLKGLWHRAFPEPQSARGSCLKTIQFLPTAIKPFEANRVWARYIDPTKPGGDTFRRDNVDLFNVCLWVFDPSKVPNQGMSAAKPESYSPYAPGIYAAMLTEIPASIVNHVVDTNPPYDLNSADLRLSELERAWFHSYLEDSPDKYQFYAIPIYRMGFPLFCVIAAVPVGGWTLSLLHQLLATEKEIITNRIVGAWSMEEYSKFALRALNALGNEGLTKQLPQVVLEQGEWNSWLDTIPGMKHFEGDPNRTQFAKFQGEHESIIDELTKEPFIQISEALRRKTFFNKASKANAAYCGHEYFTKRHRTTASDVAKVIQDLAPRESRIKGKEKSDSGLVKHAIDSLEHFSRYRGTLPETDVDPSPVTSAYHDINWRFQIFKALFCRSGENAQSDYRLSPIMFYAVGKFYLPDLPDVKLRINGFPINKTLNSDVCAKPKIGIGDAWLKLKQFWKCVIPQYLQQCDIGGGVSESDDAISVKVVFTRPVIAGDGGASFAALERDLANLGCVEGSRKGQITGFLTTFRKSAASCEIISELLS